MLPDIANLEFNVPTPLTTPPGLSFLFDFSIGDFVTKDGRLIVIQDQKALKVWITKVLQTEKFRYKIYERADKNEYGVILEDLLIGRDYPQALVESELKREITAALLKHPFISSVSGWQIVKTNPLVAISFRVNLADGDSFTQEVNF